MKITILAPRRTPEVECVMAFAGWQGIVWSVDIQMGNLKYTNGSGVPAIRVHEPGNDDFTVRGFDGLYEFVRRKGYCLI